eukprot:scaffold2430_cov137-Isochrysis_galbana.AAC.2
MVRSGARVVCAMGLGAWRSHALSACACASVRGAAPCPHLLSHQGGELLEHASELGQRRLHLAHLLLPVFPRPRRPECLLLLLPGCADAPHVDGDRRASRRSAATQPTVTVGDGCLRRAVRRVRPPPLQQAARPQRGGRPARAGKGAACPAASLASAILPNMRAVKRRGRRGSQTG